MNYSANTILLLCLLLVGGSSARNADFTRIQELQDFTVKKTVLLEDRHGTSGTISVGAGYSEDSQQVTQQQCFKASVTSISKKEAEIQLDQAASFSDLENVLQTQVSVGGTYQMFSGKVKANYMRSIQDKDYSMSLNYYASFKSKVTVQLDGYGVNALTKFGQDAYNSSESKKYFGLVCGDHYIASYDQGAMLTLGLNVKLSSHEEKKEFKSRAKINIGPFNIFKAAASVQKVSTEKRISGLVALHALQIGGEPTQLTQILNHNVLTCNITAMEDCLQTAKTLLAYAKDFGNQIKNNTNFEPLGMATYHPVKWIGLIPPASLVTAEVKKYRQELANLLRVNEYYTEKLYSLGKGYPVELDVAFVENANYILTKTDRNMRILMDPQMGAVGCFNEPDRCKDVRDYVYSNIQHVSSEDLSFMKNMKYRVAVSYGFLYNTGGETEKSWKFIPSNSKNKFSLDTIYIEDKYCSFVLSMSSIEFRLMYNGVWDQNRKRYVGTETRLQVDKNETNEAYFPKLLSPFFFEEQPRL